MGRVEVAQTHLVCWCNPALDPNSRPGGGSNEPFCCLQTAIKNTIEEDDFLTACLQKQVIFKLKYYILFTAKTGLLEMCQKIGNPIADIYFKIGKRKIKTVNIRLKIRPIVTGR